jgi:hypothetical protein
MPSSPRFARRHPPLARTAGALLAGAALITGAAPAGASPRGRALHIDSPAPHAKLHGRVKFVARATGRPRRVLFYIDGKLLSRDRRAPYAVGKRGYLTTRGLRRGIHTFKVKAIYPRQVVKTTAVRAVVRVGGSPPAADSSGSSPWGSTFATGDFSEWGDSGDRSDAGIYRVEDAAAAGIPARPGSSDTKVARFEVTPAQYSAGHMHSKVYQGFSLKNTLTSGWNGMRPLGDRDAVAGTYRAWFYLPADYKMYANYPQPENAGVTMFQFKEFWPIAADDTYSMLQTALGLRNALGVKMQYGKTVGGVDPRDQTTPLLCANWQFAERKPGDVGVMKAPLGRWFEVRADVHPGDRTDYFVDGRKLTTITSADLAATAPQDSGKYDRYPRDIGMRMPANQYGGASTSWVFGVGHYGVPGKLWVDQAGFTPFGG